MKMRRKTMPFKKGHTPWNKKLESKEKIKIMTIKEKLIQELKENGKSSLKDLEKKYGNQAAVELIQLVSDRKICSTISINDGQTYYIKR